MNSFLKVWSIATTFALLILIPILFNNGNSTTDIEVTPEPEVIIEVDTEEIERLKNEIEELESEIEVLEGQLIPIEEVKAEAVEKFNNEILGMIELVKMNPSIFEKDEDGYLQTQYLLNVIELNDMMSRDYGYIQMILYELTGEHDPIIAIDKLASEIH